MAYTLNIYKDNEHVNELNVNELDVLKAYFNAKNINNGTKIKTLNYDSVGTIHLIKIKFNNGYEYDYQLRG